MNILFVHGWGSDSRIWYPIARLLPDHQIYFLDFGYLNSQFVIQNNRFKADRQEINENQNWHWIKQGFSSDQIPALTQSYLAIGHSMGVAWLLKNSSAAFQGLMSIAGFVRFANSDNLPALNKMKEGLKRNPVLQMRSFWRSANIQIYMEEYDGLKSDAVLREYFNVKRLMEGLEYLSHCNEMYRLNELKCNVRALASYNDSIVSKVTTDCQWPKEQLRWTETGGHGLPLSEVHWCAEEIHAFIRDLEHT